MIPIPIEDLFEDIIAKSMRGRHISEGELAATTGVERDVLARLCRGEFCDESALCKVAKALSLDPDALTTSASRSWTPRPVSLDGLFLTNTTYRDMRVNAFLVWDPKTCEAAVFDTGTSADGLIEKATQESLTIGQIFLTHTHNDHIADLDRLRAAAPEASLYANVEEPWPGADTFSAGTRFSIGELQVETFLTSGHSVGGTTYFISGLDRPVAVVGDAMFAGSMGGGIISFEDAWTNNRDKILTLPEDTVLCPGHGPLTSVGEEKRRNPFFAGLYR
ncbi:MAG: MBL fold metallo-hydrolase [Verrucomicrobiota bacterium]